MYPPPKSLVTRNSNFLQLVYLHLYYASAKKNLGVKGLKCILFWGASREQNLGKQLFSSFTFIAWLVANDQATREPIPTPLSNRFRKKYKYGGDFSASELRSALPQTTHFSIADA